MAKRRVSNKPQFADFQNYESLSQLPSLLENVDETPDFSGTSSPELVENFTFPRVPANPEQFQQTQDDQFLVDDVPGIPPGIELLGDLAKTESKQDSLDMLTETLPPDTLPQEPTMGIDDPLETIKGRIEANPEMAQYAPPEIKEQVSETIETTNAPDEIESRLPPAVNQTFGEIREEVSPEDIPEDGLGAVTGSVQSVELTPKLNQTVKNLLNIREGDVPPEGWAHSRMMENILTKQEEELNQRELMLKESLESGTLSDLDKVALGIALVAPVLIGLMVGKEAFVSSLGGTLQGLGKGMAQQQERKGKLIKDLESTQKERFGIQEKRANLKKEMLSNIENPEMRKFLKNNDIIKTETDEDGNERLSLGSDAAIIGDTIGIDANHESNALWYDANNLRDDDSIKEFKENSIAAKKSLSEISSGNKIINEVVELMDIIKEQDPNLYDILKQNWQGLATPFADKLYKLTVDIVGEDGKSQKVQALPLLKSKITMMQDIYNREYLTGNRLTDNLMKHWKDAYPDPTSVDEWMRSDFSTMQAQSKEFLRNLNDRAIARLTGIGFLREPLEMYLKSPQIDLLEGKQRAMQDVEQNPEKYKEKIKK